MNLARRWWSADDDARLLEAVAAAPRTNGRIVWPRVVELLKTPGLTAKKCRTRYCDQLSTDRNHTKITDEEGKRILELYERHGPKWAVIAAHLDRRTPNRIKNYATCRIRAADAAATRNARRRAAVSPPAPKTFWQLSCSPPAVESAHRRTSPPPMPTAVEGIPDVEVGFGADFDEILALGALETRQVEIDAASPTPRAPPPSTISFRVVKRVRPPTITKARTYVFGQSMSQSQLHAKKDAYLVPLLHCA